MTRAQMYNNSNYVLFSLVAICAVFVISASANQLNEQTNLNLNNNNNNATSGCAKYNTCGNCTDSRGCVWCESNSKCLDGDFYGPEGKILSGCDDWRWEQCKVNGRIVFWSSVAGVAFLLFIVVLCVCLTFYCCCCRSRSHRRRDYDTDLSVRNDERRVNEIRQKHQSKRAEFMDKYGSKRSSHLSEREPLKRY